MNKEYKMYQIALSDYLRRPNASSTVVSVEKPSNIEDHAELNAEDWVQINYPETYNLFIAQQNEQFELFCRKHRDYGHTNLVDGLSPKETMQNLYLKMQDKLNRFKNLINQTAAVSTETMDDTLDDISNYSNIAQIISKGTWGK